MHPLWGWCCIVALALALVVGAFVVPAMGVPEYLRPSATDENAWTPTGTSAHLAIDEGTADGATSMLSSTATGQRFIVQLSNPVSVSGRIDSVTVYATVRGTERYYICVDNGSGTIANSARQDGPGATWTEVSFPITAPDGTWDDPAELNGIRVGCLSENQGGWGNLNVTQMYVLVNYTVDADAPAVATTSPASNDVLTGTTKSITGTASDAGTGVASVDVRIQRSGDNYYWNGTTSMWVAAETWNDAAGTTSWSYNWALAAGQDREYTYTVSSRAYDGAGNLGTATTVTGVRVDNLGPQMLSATALGLTSVDIVFSEGILAGSVSGSDFTLDNGLTVTSATRDATDPTVVHLVTSSQTPGTTYTVTMAGAAQFITDLYANNDRNNSVAFSGFTPEPLLTVAPGADVPSAKTYVLPGASAAVDQFTLSASYGPVTVTQIVVEGLGPVSDITSVRLFKDDGDDIYTIADALIGTTSFSGAAATFTPPGYTIAADSADSLWVVYTVGAGAANGSTYGSRLVTGGVTVTLPATATFSVSPITSAGAGATLEVDRFSPLVSVISPASSALITADPTIIQGTASDDPDGAGALTGSGVATVDVRVARSDGTYWDGVQWASDADTWVPAAFNAGTGNWTYSWDLPTDENVDEYTYSINARATDAVGTPPGVSPTITGVRIDTLGPTIASVTPPASATQVDVVFSEALAAASIGSGDFTIAGLAVSAAVLQGDGRTVRLTTAAQTPLQSYTVSVSAGALTDMQGVANTATSSSFTGFSVPSGTLTVTQATEAAAPGLPNAPEFVMVDAESVVDAYHLTASGGSVRVGTIRVTGLDTADTLRSDISEVRLYLDSVADGYLDFGADSQLGASVLFNGDISGTGRAVFDGLNYLVADGTTARVWVVYTIAPGASDGHGVGSRLANGDVVATAGSVSAYAALTSGNAGATLSVDSAGPAVAISAPADGTTLTGNAVTVTGTASDGPGSGVASVSVKIGRSDGKWYDRATQSFQLVEMWDTADGTTDWSMPWSLSADDHAYTYTVSAVARDAVLQTGTTQQVTVQVDNVGPRITIASPLDATHVDVVLSEPINPTTVGMGDFVVSSLTVSAVEVLAGNSSVRLTVSDQIPDESYTVSVAPGVFFDPYGNPNQASSYGFLGFGGISDTTPPSPPTTVGVLPGTDPTIAVVSWSGESDNVGVTSFKVYRAVSPTGVYVLAGSAGTSPYSDTTGVPGQDYWYKVTAIDAAGNESVMSAAAGPVAATWTRSPHATYASDTTYCKMCHQPHQAASARNLLRDTGTTPGELGVCYACHDGSGASANVKTGADNSFVLASGHTLENVDSGQDLTNACSGCHGPHRDYATNALLPKSMVNGTPVGAADNTWCLACHNSDNDWYSGTYELTVDATGYPTLGTFPTDTGAGYVAYTDVALNAHMSIPASATIEREQGDCLYCHKSHGSTSAYDSLSAAFQPPSKTDPDAADPTSGVYDDYATLCFQCHGTEPGGSLVLPLAGATDIQQFVTSAGERSGHRIKTAGGTYAVGVPLGCYECHNAHGSARNNAHMFSDALGQNLNTSTAVGDEHLVREFCFTCHTTAGDDVLTPDNVAYAWDSAANAGAGDYVAVAAGSKIAGLARDAALDANVLRLPAANGHYRDDPQSCYKCHGSNYAAGGSNVHNPSGGVSQGGEPCYNCHTDYQAYMEDGVAPKVGDQRATVYHHVMGGMPGAGYVDGDFAPGPSGTYPSSGFVNILCVTCHVDHDKFNDTPGSNLRKDAINAPVVAANTDFGTGGFQNGVCTTCHTLSMSKADPDGSGQAADSTVITQAIDPGRYGASAHRYQVASEFGPGNTFLADCSKCHSDEQPKEFQTSEFAFGTHWSASNRIVSAFGAVVTNPLAEEHCYGCHSRTADGRKQVNGLDQFKTKPMTTPGTEYVWQQFQLASTHPVVAAGGDSVECESCHNPHRITSTTQKVSDPVDTLLNYTYGGASADTNQPVFCLKCHGDSNGLGSAALPVQLSDGSKYVPYSVTQNGLATANGLNNKKTNAARGHWSDTSAIGGAISAAERVSCAECHDNHGSSVVKLIGVFDPADGLSKITNPVTLAKTTITANNTAVCYACHDAASVGYPVVTREAGTGYSASGTWPGRVTYTSAYVPDTSGNGHLNAQGVATKNALPTSYAAGDCKVCHDVHGAANTYDELRGTFNNSGFSLCFDCHDANGPAATNIKAYYPGTVGGAGSDTMGHLIKTAGGNLAVGDVVPCYDCHNTHGSGNAYGLTINTMTGPATTIVVGDAAGEIKMAATDHDDVGEEANVRNFCFVCHTTADTVSGNPLGWNGTALAQVSVGAKVEGLDRTTGTRLRLPAGTGHASTDTGTSCYQCHQDDYSSLTSNNVHNPSGGVSAGGSDCYGCHSGMQPYMEDDTAPKTGASNATVYHHVLGGDPDVGGPATYTDGDKAFVLGQYPTSTTDVFCLSCHVDHGANGFQTGAKSSNLRGTFTATPGKTNTDWDDSTDTGICTSCHGTVSLAKSAATEKKSDGRAQTPTVNNLDYNGSAHKYVASSTFTGGTVFNASCSKCHSDEQTKDYQNSPYEFGTHYSANQHVLSALGGANVDQLQETHCYRCHAERADFASQGGTLVGTAKPTAGKDWYGVANMTTSGTEKIYKQFQLTSKHPVASGLVECESCHNVHEVSSTSKVSDPNNTYNAAPYAAATDRVAFCLKCHNGVLKPRTIDAGTYVPYPIQVLSASIKSTNAVRGHWSDGTAAGGSISASETQECAVCHDQHGSNAPKLLGVYDPVAGTSKIAGTQQTVTLNANNNTVCAACHNAASTGYPSYARAAGVAQYPISGTYPGLTVYNSANGIHKGDADGQYVRWTGTVYADGDCKNCHDVHGTANAFDELRGTYTRANFGTCFECHDGSPSSINIKQFYPQSNGGGTGVVNSADTNFGHKIQTTVAGGLTAGDGLPCYNCHNPHGNANSTDGLLVISQNTGAPLVVGDEAGEIVVTTVAGVRRFCFSCHAGNTTSVDTTIRGTAGTLAGGYVAITGTALVEGINRLNPASALLLPPMDGHYTTLGTQGSCYDCHGNDYAVGGNNVHNPSAGVSKGGQLCNGCHKTHATMTNDTATYHHVLDSATPFRAPNAANTYPTDSTPADVKVECVSCHTDHNNFNANKGANLRVSIDSNSGAAGSYTNTDFLAVAPYGICVSCHDTALTKNTIGQKTVGASATTPAISGAAYLAATTGHNYVVNDAAKIGYGTSAFQANCTKCHDDDMDTGSKMGSTYKVGVHKSTENRIAKALGAALVGTSTQTEENLCYKCHTGAVAGTDGYGARAMTARARGIAVQFAKTSKHNVAGYAGIHKSDEYATAPTSIGQATALPGWWGTGKASKHVECEDCHNVHAAQAATNNLTNNNAAPRTSLPTISGANLGVWGVTVGGTAGDWIGSAAIGGGVPLGPTYTKAPAAAYEWQMCLKCHSRYAWGNQGAPAVPSGGMNNRGASTMTDVGKDFDPANYAYHPVFRAGVNNPPITANTAWGATGSAGRRNISGVTNTNGLSNTFVDGWLFTSRVTCTDCHGNNDWSATASRGPHGSGQAWLLRGANTAVKVTIATGAVNNCNTATLATSFCQNCHRADVYGNGAGGNSATTMYGTLSRADHPGEFGSCDDNTFLNPYAGCTSCHGGRPSSTGAGTPSGLIHGTSSGPGAEGGNPLGWRFCNGAAWDSHTTGKTGTIGCSTLAAADSYSSCTKHGSFNNKTFTATYAY